MDRPRPHPVRRAAAALALALVAGRTAPAREREFFRSYGDAQAALQAKDCAAALALLDEAVKLEPTESARKRTYGMNVIEYFPHLGRAKALHCLGRRDEALAALATAEKQGASPAAEIAALRTSLLGAAGAAPGTVCVIHDGPEGSYETLLKAFRSGCQATLSVHSVAAPDVATKARAARSGVVLAIGPRSLRLARESLGGLPLLVAPMPCRGAAGSGVERALPMPAFAEELAVLRRLRPSLTIVALLHAPTTCAADLEAAKAAASAAAVRLVTAGAGTAKELPPALRTLLAERPDFVVAMGFEAAGGEELRYIIASALERGVPVVGHEASMVRQGALAAIVAAPAEAGRQAAALAASILGGAASPAAEAPMPPAVALNLKVAKNLGIQVPPDLVEGAVLVVRP